MIINNILFQKLIKKNIYLTSKPLPIEEDYSIRTVEEEKLYDLLKEKGATILLTGNAGSGKSYLARKLFYRLEKNYKRLAWVKYTTDLKSSLLLSFENCKHDNNYIHFSNILNALSVDVENTILFIDGVDKSAINDELLSRITGFGITILITSRCKEIPPYSTYEISKLTEMDCANIFYTYYKEDENRQNIDIVNKIASMLEYNLTSIIMLARNICSTYSLSECYEKLKKEFKNETVGNSAQLQNIINNLASVSNLNNDEIMILKYFSLVPFEEISYEIVTGFNLDKEKVNLLIDKGWIIFNKKHNTYTIHNLVKEHFLNNSDLDDIYKEFLKYIYKKIVDREQYGKAINMKTMEYIKYIVMSNYTNSSYYVEVCSWIGDYYFEANKLDDALTFYLKAFRGFNKDESINKRIIHNVCFNVVGIYMTKELYSEALQYCENIEPYITKEDYHEYLAKYKNLIGDIYEDLSDYNRALDCYKDALRIQQSVQESDNREKAVTLNNIGTVYHYMGDLENALKFYCKAQEIWEYNKQGKDSDVVTLYNNFAEIHNDLGDYKKALEYHLKTYDIIKHSKDCCDTDIATSYNNIGVVYYNLENYNKSLYYQKKALRIQKRDFGNYHQSTARTFNNLGAVYYELGKYNKSYKLALKGMEIRQNIFGKKNVSTAISYNCVGKALLGLEKYDEAIEYHNKALNIFKTKLPNYHKYIAKTYFHLSEVYFKMGKTDESLSLLENSYNSCKQTLGEKHPFTVKVNRIKKERYQI